MILFDQILIPVRMRERYVDGSAKVFNPASARRGSEQTRASDHLPVFADFIFGGVEPPRPPVAAVRIEQLAMPGSILITPEVLRLAEGYVQVKPLGPVPVKGLSAPVEVYEVLGAGEVRTRLQAAAVRGLSALWGVTVNWRNSTRSWNGSPPAMVRWWR